ncbi:uncharacterized protein M6B38_168990 [Iris pallida]|uniref:Uncharacterized protein n=1 Tax=Iris pallida TaxID=29817 RepID=A0AAX6EVE2_IRIPA|nr:uncharacterized protein M6B38_168990 [Iris pallida]
MTIFHPFFPFANTQILDLLSPPPSLAPPTDQPPSPPQLPTFRNTTKTYLNGGADHCCISPAAAVRHARICHPHLLLTSVNAKHPALPWRFLLQPQSRRACVCRAVRSALERPPL